MSKLLGTLYTETSSDTPKKEDGKEDDDDYVTDPGEDVEGAEVDEGITQPKSQQNKQDKSQSTDKKRLFENF